MPEAIISAESTEAPTVRSGRFTTEIWGRSITLEATATDRQGNPVPNVTVTVVHDDGTPYKDGDGNPARDVTDKNGKYKIKTTVKGSYRLEIVPPRQNQKE